MTFHFLKYANKRHFVGELRGSLGVGYHPLSPGSEGGAPVIYLSSWGTIA